MHPLSRLFSASRPRTWLESPCAPHLWTLELQDIADPFNADGLWDQATGDEPDASDAAGRGERRLRQALHDHRRWVKRREHGKLVEQGQAFTDVVVTVPQRTWNEALRLGMEKAEILIDNLEQAHARDFEDILPQGRAPRYLVKADPALAAGRVRVHFGYGVHLPAEGETPLLELLYVNDDGASLADLPPWVQYRDGLPLERPAGLYADQDAQLLCGDGPLDCPWFDGGRPGYVLLRRGARGEWVGFGDDVHTRYRGRRPAAREHGPQLVFEALDDLDRPPLIVELDAPCEPGAAGYEKTLAPSAALQPGLRPLALWLDGFALPRLPPELRGWTLWLDDAGMPASGDARNGPALDWDGHRLWLRGMDAPPRALEVPSVLDLPAGRPRLEQSPTGGSLALLRLESAMRLGIEADTFTIGRFDPTPGARQADLLLDLLDQVGGLRWRGRDRQGFLGNLGLGRRHASLRLLDDSLLVSAAGSLPVALIDAQGRPLPIAEPGEDAEPHALQQGQSLLAGCYLLRFDDDL